MPSFLCKIWRFVANIAGKVVDFVLDVVGKVVTMAVEAIKDVADGLFGGNTLLLVVAGLGALYLLTRGKEEDASQGRLA